MKWHLLGFGLAYALGAGTVLLVQPTSPSEHVSELPIPKFKATTLPGDRFTPQTGFGQSATVQPSSEVNGYGIHRVTGPRRPPAGSGVITFTSHDDSLNSAHDDPLIQSNTPWLLPSEAKGSRKPIPDLKLSTQVFEQR